MASGEVNYPVASNESGNTLYIKVVDINTGKPITQGVCITGNYNTSPAQHNAWGQQTCSSGPGQTVGLFTDNTGIAEWVFPYTCPSTFNLLAQTPNYADESFNISTGIITGPVNVLVSMSPGTMSNSLGQLPPICQGAWADLNQASQNAAQGGSKTGAAVGGFAETLGLYGTIAAVAVAIVVIVVVVFTHRPGGT